MIGMNYSEESHSETKLVWGLTRRKRLINNGWDFLGLEQDDDGDWGCKFGKPVEPQLFYEPTIVVAWDIAPPKITVAPRPKTLYCPHCGYALVASTIPSHAYQYPSIDRHTWICNNCIAEVSS